MKCIIIDDEKSSREILVKMLTRYCPDITISDQANSIESAYQSILLHKPDLLFLDIEMPEGNAFDLLSKFDKIDFKIIFTTAYEQYAIEAIKVEAVDYLLKPISVQEVINAVKKLKKKVNTSINKEELLKLLATFNIPQQANPYIPIPTSNGYEMLNIADIIRCEANESYTFIYLNNSTKKTVSKKLGELSESLPGHDFFRIHHSHLINRKHIKNYLRGEGGTVHLSDNTEVPVSRRKKTEFIEWLMAI